MSELVKCDHAGLCNNHGCPEREPHEPMAGVCDFGTCDFAGCHVQCSLVPQPEAVQSGPLQPWELTKQMIADAVNKTREPSYAVLTAYDVSDDAITIASAAVQKVVEWLSELCTEHTFYRGCLRQRCDECMEALREGVSK